MTLPTSYSWSLVGEALSIPYEASEGRRVNAIGAYFSHGPDAGRFEFETYALVPKSRNKAVRKPLAEVAAAHGLSVERLGPIDSERFLAFVWRVAGRPSVASEDWRRERPLIIVLDNYSVHKGQAVKEALPLLEAANVSLFYLPSYSPQLSKIEPIWRSVKGHGMPYRTQTVLGQMKSAVDDALHQKATQLRLQHDKTTEFRCMAA